MLALKEKLLNLIVRRRIPCALQRRRNLIHSAHGSDSPAKNWICALSGSRSAATRKGLAALGCAYPIGEPSGQKKQGYDLSAIPLSHINEQAGGYTLFGPAWN